MSHESVIAGPLRSHSGGLSEPIGYKPGNEWGRLAEWSSSRSGPLPQPDDAKLWPRRRPFHGERSSERESLCGHDMVTGVQRDGMYRHDMTGDQEEVTYCSPSTSSGKQKKNRSTSQPQFRSDNTPATIEADQNLLAPQQLANNNNSANFQNNINRISKLPKSLTTTMPTFDRKSEKFELFGDFFQTSLKIHNQLTVDDRINYFHSLMRGDALETFKNNNGPTQENLGEILAVFRRKYVKPQSIWFPNWFLVFYFCVPECVRICGFKRKSSNLVRAPKMPDSVLLNSWDSFLVALCEDSLPSLGSLEYQGNKKRTPLRDKDRLWNDPQLVPGFLSCCSWIFPDRLRNKSELVGSEENRQALTGHPRYEILSY